MADDLESSYTASTAPYRLSMSSLRRLYDDLVRLPTVSRVDRQAVYEGVWEPHGYGAGVSDDEFAAYVLAHRHMWASHDLPDGSSFPQGALWRSFLFGHLTPLQMLHEISDALYGHTVTLPPLTQADVHEGVRRVLVFRDARRAGTRGKLSQAQVAAVARDLLRETDVAAACAGGAAGVLRERVTGRLGEHPATIMQAWPTAWEVGMTTHVVGVRALMLAWGALSRFVHTPHGQYHVYVINPQGRRDAAHPPLCVLHGLFTTSVSMLPLALLLADALDRVVYVPDHLDFDFSFSRSYERQRTEAAAREGRRVDANAPVQAMAGRPVSPLAWSDHVPAVTSLLEVLFQGEPCDLLGHSFGGWLAQKIAHASPQRVRRLVLLCPGGLGRYRMVSSASPLAGAATTIDILSRRMPRPMAALGAQVFDMISRAPHTVHMLATVEHDDYFGPGCPVQQPSLLLWGDADDLHRVWMTHERSAEAAASSETHDEVMLRDTPNGVGFWLRGANHAINVDSLVAVERLVVSFLSTGGAALGSGRSRGTSSGVGEEAAAVHAATQTRSGGLTGGADAARSASSSRLRVLASVFRLVAAAAGTDREVVAMKRGNGAAAGVPVSVVEASVVDAVSTAPSASAAGVRAPLMAAAASQDAAPRARL